MVNRSYHAPQHRGNQQHFQERDKQIYSHCGMTGYPIDKCYKLHEYPPEYKHGKVQSNSGHVKLQFPFSWEQCD